VILKLAVLDVGSNGIEADIDSRTDREGNDKILINILEDICRDKPIVRTRDDDAYYVQLENPIDGNKKTYSFNDPDFHDFVRVKYYEKTGKTINISKLNDSISTLKALFNLQQNERLQTVERLSNRIDGDIRKDRILYDLATDTGEVVEITPDGWSIIHLDNPKFRKSVNTLPQVIPIRSSDSMNNNYGFTYWQLLENNRLFWPIPEGEFNVFISYIAYCLIPLLSKPILILRGENDEPEEGEGGSGKSTLIRYIKQIIDPSTSELSSIPKDVKDLKILLSKSHYTPFDNVTHINTDVSDALCQGVTGGSISSRKLYTNGELNTIRYKNCIAINGINLRKIRPDLRDRSIIFDVERIDDYARKTETELEETFEKLLPELLGRIFDVLSNVMKYMKDNPDEVEKIRRRNLPRMADFAWYGEIISRVMFGDDHKNEFLVQYQNKTIAQNGNWGTNGMGLENHAVVQGLRKLGEILERSNPYPEDHPQKEFLCLAWEGSCTKLYACLSDIVVDYKILKPLEIKDSKLFPQAANSLSRILKTLGPILEKVGIKFYQGKSNDARRDKTIRVEIKYSKQMNEANEC